MPLTCKSTTWKLPSKARRVNRLRRPPGKSTLIRSPTSHEPQARGTIEKSREGTDFFTSSRTDLLSHWTFENCPKLSSVRHFQSEQAFTPPTHFRTLFGFSEKFGNCRPPLSHHLLPSNFYQFPLKMRSLPKVAQLFVIKLQPNHLFSCPKMV